MVGRHPGHGKTMDQNLKHRLTGAVILVSVAVIFIPVILEGPDNEWAPLSHSIPEAPQLDYRAHLEVPAPIPAPVKPAAAPKPAEPAKTAVPVPEPEPEPEPVEQPQPAIKSLSGWYVQVGSFSQELNASGLSKRLELSGYETRLQKATTETGYAWRVMVGPSKTKDVAEKLRDRLARERQLKGIVMNNPG
jgi:DedD protein